MWLERSDCGRKGWGRGRARSVRGPLGSRLCRPWRPLCEKCSGRNEEPLERVSRGAQLLKASIQAVLWLLPEYLSLGLDTVPGVAGDDKIYRTMVLFFKKLIIRL